VSVGNFDLKIQTENISSVNPLVVSEFLVVQSFYFIALVFGLGLLSALILVTTRVGFLLTINLVPSAPTNKSIKLIDN
jgi:hypothetical protein